MPDSVSPLPILREAIKAVPSVKWALGVGGLLAVIALVYMFQLEPRVAFVGLIVLFAFMSILVLFARASALASGATVWPALIFTWFTLIMFMATTMSLFGSVFFNSPLPLQKWLTGEEAMAMPVIPDADSGWIDGGSSPNKFCDPQLATVQAKYPDLKITMQMPPEGHRSEYNPFKHDIYRYTCVFTASKK